MDKRIRRNEICIVGQPRCDFVFSSARTCFIAYGFQDSTLEMEILKNLLAENQIQAEEAGGNLAPGQNAFCAKICSKIITSQFCIVLINNEEDGEREIPNANVNMEYGLMLGFNKYVIPFQKEAQSLPFNLTGLDTIKYTNQNFRDRAEDAIKQAGLETRQEETPTFEVDQLISTYLMYRSFLMNPISSQGDKEIFEIGRPLGFNLLNDFSGLNYAYFGNFTYLRSEIVIWRLKTQINILNEREKSFGRRVQLGLAQISQASWFEEFFEKLKILALVTSNEEKSTINGKLEEFPEGYSIEVVSLDDVRSVFDS